MAQQNFSQDLYQPYFMNDHSYDMFASQYGSPMTPDFTPASPWSGMHSPAHHPDDLYDHDHDHDHEDHHDTDSSTVSSPSHHHRHAKTSDALLESRSGAPGSKSGRANRYKNCSEAALTRRRAQNRENQRAYRKRKEERIVELQQQLDEMSHKNEVLSEAYTALVDECTRLRAREQQQQQQTIKSESSEWQPSSLLLDPKLTGLSTGIFPEQWWAGALV